MVAVVGVMSFFEKRCLSVMKVEVECLRVSPGLVGCERWMLWSRR